MKSTSLEDKIYKVLLVLLSVVLIGYFVLAKLGLWVSLWLSLLTIIILASGFFAKNLIVCLRFCVPALILSLMIGFRNKVDILFLIPMILNCSFAIDSKVHEG
jgi:uncharacterized membrane protein (Fun14 family)